MATLRATNFETDVPMPISLKKPGENVAGKFGDQVLFRTGAGDAFYLDPQPASGIEIEMRRLGIRYGEEFSLTRAGTGGFIVRHLAPGTPPAAGNGYTDAAPRNGTGASSQAAPAATQPAQINNNGNSTPAPATLNAATACMCSSMCSAVDAVMETQAYAARKGLGLTFSEESVRAIGLSIYISACQGRRA